MKKLQPGILLRRIYVAGILLSVAGTVCKLTEVIPSDYAIMTGITGLILFIPTALVLHRKQAAPAPETKR